MDVSDLYCIEGGDGGAAEGGAVDGEPSEDGRASVVLNVHVMPGAGRSATVGRHGTSLKVRVAAAPEGGRANEACAALLAETFGLKEADVELTGGATSRMKQFRLRDVELEEFTGQLERTVGGTGTAGGNRAPGRR